MVAILIVRNVEEEGVEDVAEGDKIVVGGLVRDGGKRCSGGGKNGRDFFGRHDGRAVRQMD